MSKNKPLILVTGAKGQLGKTLQEVALEEKAFVWVFCDKSMLDICDPMAIQKAFMQYKPDYCINLAAFTNVKQAEEKPLMAKRVNVAGVQQLVDNCNQYKTCLLHLSTDYVFDGSNNKPYVETDITNPQSVYGQTKLDGELAMQQINPTNSIIIRTSWVYSKFGNNFVKGLSLKLLFKYNFSITYKSKLLQSSSKSLMVHK